MNLDQKKIERTTHTLLDVGAAIGGFFGLCTSVLATLVVIFATTDVQSDLRESLFSETKKKDDSTQSRCQRAKAFFLGILSDYCRCCSRKWREAKASEVKQEDHLNAEINLLSIVRKLRFFDSAVKQLLPSPTLVELQKLS